MAEALSLGFDLGGTQVRAALVQNGTVMQRAAGLTDVAGGTRRRGVARCRPFEHQVGRHRCTRTSGQRFRHRGSHPDLAGLVRVSVARQSLGAIRSSRHRRERWNCLRVRRVETRCGSGVRSSGLCDCQHWRGRRCRRRRASHARPQRYGRPRRPFPDRPGRTDLLVRSNRMF